MTETQISVLVVEDEAVLRLVITNELADEGFEVFEASNADEVIAIIRDNRSIHAIFTDVQMPGSMDGSRLAAFVRDRWPPIKIIVTSGSGLIDEGMLSVKGAFLRKPYQPATVVATIRSLVAG